MSKYLDLAKKLKALADQGVGGEKDNALVKLHALMYKHGITAAELEFVEVEKYAFKVPRNKKTMFVQVASTVLPSDSRWYYKGNVKTVIWIECTRSQFIELTLKYDFYWAAYIEERNLLQDAFIQKHKLCPPPREKEKDEPLSIKEYERRKRLFKLAEGLQDREFHKALPGTKLLS
jgi:hypothetical protein